jgi:hypothetical protein
LGVFGIGGVDMGIIVSYTAYQQGFGSDRYKGVSGLTPTERLAVKNGETVVYDSGRPCGGSHGTTWRQVVYHPRFGGGGYWDHCVPDNDVLAEIKKEA